MKLHIPQMEETFTLAQNIVVSVYHDIYNRQFLIRRGLADRNTRWSHNYNPRREIVTSNVHFEAGTQFRVKRIFVRQGGKTYDAVRFAVVGESHRFSLSVREANQMEFVDAEHV